MKKLVLFVSLAILGLLLIGCSQVNSPETDTSQPRASYTVTFDANGGSGTMASQTFTEGVPQELTEYGFTLPTGRDGFFRWSTQKNGEGTTYYNAETISITKNITLYAVWFNYTPSEHFDVTNGEITKYNGSDSVVHIPQKKGSETITSIGVEAFQGNSSLKSITIPNTVTKIGSTAFEKCTSLEIITIPNSVTNVGDNTFRGCASLESITIGEGVIIIGEGAFSDCSSLQSITVDSGNAKFESEAGVLYNEAKTRLIRYPQSKPNAKFCIPNSVTSIGSFAFNLCSSLQEISIPNSVKLIEHQAFAGCTSLKSISIPNSVTSIEGYAFLECSGLQSITIPNSVTSIEFATFRYCTNLESITIPNSVTSIGSYAFSECSSLQKVFTNYTKTVGVAQYPIWNASTGWNTKENDKFFDAEWLAIP